ncbi:hypothetical protein [Parvicella tangerina]|nr:hypothetical protein [Parvicella tangerina]
MKTKLIILAIGLLSYSSGPYAQIGGKLGKLKDKAKDKVSNTTGSVAVSAYDKHMKEGNKNEEAGDFIAAYKSYQLALSEKSGDYTASSAKKRVESSAEEQYEKQYEDLFAQGNCDEIKSLINDWTATIDMTPTRKEKLEYTRDNCEKALADQQNASNKAADQAAAKAAVDKLENGKAYFENQPFSTQFKSEFNIGDDIFVKFKMGKTMLEYAEDYGMTGSYTAYGYFKIYFDGKEVSTVGPYSFSSNYSGKWTDFDAPLSFGDSFTKNIDQNEALMSSTQGIWLIPESVSGKLKPTFIENAIKEFADASGKHNVKVDFCLGTKSNEIKGVVASGSFSVNIDEEGKKKLYERGPKYLRPLDESEKASVSLNSNQFRLSENALTASFELPQPPKYYAQKWCTSMSCDYDHGYISVAVLVDDIEINGYCELWDEKWESQKSFDFTVLPVNDNELNDDLASYNKEDLFEKQRNNTIVYAFIDMLYSSKIKPGKHKVTVQVAHEVAVGNDRFSNLIGEKTFEMTFTEGQLNSFKSKSNAKKLSHAGGEWTSVDNHLKSLYAEDRVVDVACTSEWKVTRNSLGVILYRTCWAEVLYKSKDGGYRIWQANEVKEDYDGSNYGKPYITGHFRTDWGPGNLNNMHFPVPATKVK